MSAEIRTRFAPSPTGYLHIGSLRTALFAYLFAKNQNGKFLLRIEDTDQERLVPGAIENLVLVLAKLGIEIDEGVTLDEQGTVHEKGQYGSYIQSNRLHIYKKYVDKLLSEDKAYYCFCSKDRLDELRKEQTALKMPTMYDGLCAALTKDEVSTKKIELENIKTNPVVRFKMPKTGITEFEDKVYGKISFENKLVDDPIILKADNYPTYHLAVVVDDTEMKITHIIRGEEWINSVPKHIQIYKALNVPVPVFAHVPLILNPDKTKLSKRQGDVAVEDYLAKGYLPEGLINFVALLGFNPKTTDELFTLHELEKIFDLSKLNKSGAVFDVQKLDWINAHKIRNLSEKELLEKVTPYFIETGWLHKKSHDNFTLPLMQDRVVNTTYLNSVINIEKERIKKLQDIIQNTKFYFSDIDLEINDIVWKKSDAETTKQVLSKVIELINSLGDFSIGNIEHSLKQFISDHNYDNGTVLWPIRYSLCGQAKSPSPFELIHVLHVGFGKDLIVQRLQVAINLFN